MKIIVHKGSQEIGGNCISLTEAGTTIWLDFGLPLKEGSTCRNAGEMKPKPDAVFVSHSHLDHYGRIKELDEKIPVYMGKLSHMLMNSLCDFNPKNKPLKNPITYFKGFETVTFGSFQITPRPVDHSAPDSYAFEIRTKDKTIFYSGDLRAHGRMQNAFKNLLQRPPRNVDLMFLEGTVMGRRDEKIKSEYELELELAEIFRPQTNISFVVSSGQNVDRIVTVIKACNRAKKTPIIGIYNAWILEQFYKKNPKTGVPNLHKFDDIEVFFDPDHEKLLESARDYFGEFYDLVHDRHAYRKNRMRDYVMVILPKSFYTGVIKKHAKNGKVNVIFFMWKSYLTEPKHLKKTGFQAIALLKKNSGVNFFEKHTSGHASKPDLQEVVSKIKPKKLCPVHTDQTKLFRETFKGVDIILPKDGEIIEF